MRTSLTMAVVTTFWMINPSETRAQSFNSESTKAGVVIFNATREYRIAKLGPLYDARFPQRRGHRFSYNARLNAVAQKYAEFLARVKSEAGKQPGHTPAELNQRLAAAGIRHCGATENIYTSWARPAEPWHQATNKAIQGWIASPRHEANLRLASMNSMGAASAGWRHGNEWHYRFVQVFINDCSPAGAPNKFPKR
jgi:uncharacterized protein YkwD